MSIWGYLCIVKQMSMSNEYDFKVKNIRDYNTFVGADIVHPLVSVIHYDELESIRHCRVLWGVYGLFILDDELESLTYGMSNYHYGSGSLVCVAPGQIGGSSDDGTTFKRSGWALLFHPDLFQGCDYEKKLPSLEFFSYHVNEAVPLNTDSRSELVVIFECLRKALASNASSEVVGKYLELVLALCSEAHTHYFPSSGGTKRGHVVSRIDEILTSYYERGEQLQRGLPTVGICADRMCMSANYLGDLIKAETGDTAIRYIGRFIITRAKDMLIQGNTVSSTAYSLGFDYPSHLARLFNRLEGISPTSYLNQAKENKQLWVFD